MKFVPFLILLLFTPLLVSAQAGKIKKKTMLKLESAALVLNEQARTMHTDSSLSVRAAACRQLITGLVDALKEPNSYNYDFANVEGIAVRNAPDNSFRLITWEFHTSRDEYRHYGAIQWNEKKLKLQPLIDRSADWRSNPENKITTADNWLGYVAYNILPGGELNGTPYYFVMGFDRKSGFVRRKVLDVITFDGYGNVQFGLPVFATYSTEGIRLTERARIILDYSAEANVVLQKDPVTGHLTYENLIVMPGSDESGPVQMPDGSYHSLQYREDGLWHETEKVFTHKYEKAPVDAAQPKENRGIFGQQLKPAKSDGGNK